MIKVPVEQKIHISFRGDGHEKDYKGEERRTHHNSQLLASRVSNEVRKLFTNADTRPTAFTISLDVPSPRETPNPEHDAGMKRLDIILDAVRTAVRKMRHPENMKRLSVDCRKSAPLDSSPDSPRKIGMGLVY